MIFYCILFVTGEYVKHLNVTTGLRRTKVWRKVLHILKMPLNQSYIIGLPCKKSKYFNWGILRKIYFCLLQWGYFHPAMHFQEVFGRYLWNGPSTLKIEETKWFFFSILGLDGCLWGSLGLSGILWDPLCILKCNNVANQTSRVDQHPYGWSVNKASWGCARAR